MIIDISFSNFLSYKDRTTLSLVAGKIRKSPERVYVHRNTRILKCMSLFGNNASGKSNMIKAIDFIQSFVDNNQFPKKYENSYFKLEDSCKNEPSSFVVTFFINKKTYIYGFRVSIYNQTLVDEWLYEINTNETKKLIYRMDYATDTFITDNYFSDSVSLAKLKTYGDDFSSKDCLFLSYINDKKDKMYKECPNLSILKSIFMSISYEINIHFPDDRFKIHPRYFETHVHKIAKILNALDVGITNVEMPIIALEDIKPKIPSKMVEDIKNDLLQTKEDDKNSEPCITIRAIKNFYSFQLDKNDDLIIKTMRFSHDNKEHYFDLREESDGTTKLLDLVEILLNSKNNITYFFDEIERCLHPSLTIKFLELFSYLAKESNTQLIFTTHESRILAVDILRRDEISFVEKDKNGCSKISSLADKNLRSDKRIYQAFFEEKCNLHSTPNFDEKELLELFSNKSGD